MKKELIQERTIACVTNLVEDYHEDEVRLSDTIRGSLRMAYIDVVSLLIDLEDEFDVDLTGIADDLQGDDDVSVEWIANKVKEALS